MSDVQIWECLSLFNVYNVLSKLMNIHDKEDKQHCFQNGAQKSFALSTLAMIELDSNIFLILSNNKNKETSDMIKCRKTMKIMDWSIRLLGMF